jgi:hypothetical protein
MDYIISPIQHSDSDQGGISAGYGFLDSILLFPVEKFRNTVWLWVEIPNYE